MYENSKGMKTISRQRQYQLRNPEKYKAQYTIANAIRRGKVKRLPCEKCGEEGQAHHDDYSKPFEIRWLCKLHHDELHYGEMIERKKKKVSDYLKKISTGYPS